jgi:hypothetical protein
MNCAVYHSDLKNLGNFFQISAISEQFGTIFTHTHSQYTEKHRKNTVTYFDVPVRTYRNSQYAKKIQFCILPFRAHIYGRRQQTHYTIQL